MSSRKENANTREGVNPDDNNEEECPNTGEPPDRTSRYENLRQRLRERLRPHINTVCREGPTREAKQRAQKAVRLLKEGKGGRREYDSLFEQGKQKDDATVAALWWLCRREEEVRGVLWTHQKEVPPLVFEEFEEARPTGLFEENGVGRLDEDGSRETDGPRLSG